MLLTTVIFYLGKNDSKSNNIGILYCILAAFNPAHTIDILFPLTSCDKEDYVIFTKIPSVHGLPRGRANLLSCNNFAFFQTNDSLTTTPIIENEERNHFFPQQIYNNKSAYCFHKNTEY